MVKDFIHKFHSFKNVNKGQRIDRQRKKKSGDKKMIRN